MNASVAAKLNGGRTDNRYVALQRLPCSPGVKCVLMHILYPTECLSTLSRYAIVPWTLGRGIALGRVTHTSTGTRLIVRRCSCILTVVLPPRTLTSSEDGPMPELITFGTAPGETLELVFVFITIMGSLAILTLLGAWWQR